MLRLTEIRLPLDHPPEDLKAAIIKRLGIAANDLLDYTLFRRGYDARKRNAIVLVYTVDVAVKNEAALLKKNIPQVAVAPDMSYHMVAQAPQGLAERPVVIGTGPCGIFAGLILAQMGFRPIILERGKAVRERTKDTWALWRQARARSRNPTCSSAKAARARFPTASCTARSRIRSHLGRKVLDRIRQGRRAGRNPVREQAAHRHFPPGRAWWKRCAHTIEALGGEYRFESKCRRIIDDRERTGARRGAGERRTDRRPIMWCWRSATARATRSRCCTSAACTSRPSPSPSAFASSIRNR